MKKIAVFFQKGGVGKTTLALILAKFFAKAGQRTVIFDNDPQANATQWMLNDIAEEERFAEAYRQVTLHNIYKLLQGQTQLDQTLIPIHENLRLLGTTTEYERAKIDFRDVPGRDQMLRHYLQGIEATTDVLLIDTPGEISDISNWALAIADTILIPVGTQLLPVESLGLTLQRIDQAQRFLNPDLKQIFIVPNQYKNRNADKVALEMLIEAHAELMIRDTQGDYIVIEDRAEVANYLTAHTVIPTSSKTAQQCHALMEAL